MYLFDLIKTCIARSITLILPPRHWYAAVYSVACVLAHWRRPGNYQYKSTLASSRAVKLNSLLALLTRQGRAFPIPIHAEHLDLFDRPRHNGLILCFTHLPLAKVALTRLVAQGIGPVVALATDPYADDTIAIWGTLERIPAIRTGPMVLLKAKRVLQQGGIINVMVDSYVGGPYSPNIFHLAEKLDTDILFVDVLLQQQGQIVVRFTESNWNGQRCANRVQGQMNELYQRTNSVLNYYGSSGYVKMPC